MSSNAEAASLMDSLPDLHMPAKPHPSRIAIKEKNRIRFIDPAKVVMVKAEGNYILLQLEATSYMLRESISKMAEKLAPYGFARIHRSFLVNAAFVQEIRPWPTGEYVLMVQGGKEYTVSRTYRKNLQLLAEAWIGTEGFVSK